VEAASDLLTYSGKQAGNLERQAVNLPGARLAVTAEPAEGCRLNCTAVKRVTSGDPMLGRLLYLEAFEFVPICTVMMTTNHRPVISETDDGIWRRVAFVPWEVQVPEEKQDKEYHLKLVQDEGPGILRWMVEGAQAYIAEGLELPEQLAAATEEYRAESDHVGAFVDDWCETGDALMESGSVLHKGFKAWALDNGGDTTLAPNTFAERLRRCGFRKGTGRRRYTWLGIQLTEGAREKLDEPYR